MTKGWQKLTNIPVNSEIPVCIHYCDFWRMDMNARFIIANSEKAAYIYMIASSYYCDNINRHIFHKKNKNYRILPFKKWNLNYYIIQDTFEMF